MELVSVREGGKLLTTSQRVHAGRLIRSFQQRDDGWHEHHLTSPFPNCPEWSLVKEGWLVLRFEAMRKAWIERGEVVYGA